MNYDTKVIETIFGTKKNLSKVIDDAIDKLELNDVAPFSEGILQFLHHFQGIASNLVTQKVWGVDLRHYYVRYLGIIS